MTFRSLLLTISLAAATSVARAQAPVAPPQPLQVRVVNLTAGEAARAGKARRDTAAVPGDLLRYTLTFVNRLPRAVTGVALANPLPAGVEFVAGSPRATQAAARVEFSADGGASWSAQPMESVIEDGRAVRRPIAPARYTGVRWLLDGQVGTRDSVVAEFSARVRGGPSRPATAPTPSRPTGR